MKINKKWKYVWGAALVIVWACIIGFFVKSNGVLSLEMILNYKPRSMPLAALEMLGLFLLKSVDFIMYSPILYAASGIMFPLPMALCLNATGIVVMLTIPYFAGRVLGTPIADRLLEKYPKLQEARKIRDGGEVILAVLMRAIGLPLHVVSIYMGATGYDYGGFLLGSLLGLLPEMIAFTVMGMSASDVSSPAFRIALAAKLTISALSIVIYAMLRKKTREQND